MTRAEAMADTRRRLLDAASRVFARDGYDGTSVKDVAEEAGFTTGAIYAHFPTKQDLFLALLQERFTTKVHDVTTIMTADTDLDAQLSALGERFGRLGDIEGDWDLLATEFWLYAIRHAEARAPLVERGRQLRRDLAQLIARRLADHGITPATPPEQIAAAVIALGDGLGFLRRLEPDAVPNSLFPTAVLHLVVGLASGATA